MNILGISCFYHDSAAALIKDGDIIAAAQEERFTRKKHDPSFPKNAIAYCLQEAGISAAHIDIVAFYEKPIVKFDRILQTHIAFAPHGLRAFLSSMPLWLRHRLWMRETFRKYLPDFTGKIIFPTHHESHAASAFYPSPFHEAAILTIDAVGEWNTTTYGVGIGNKIALNKAINFPHSLGMLYSAFTYYSGFRVNSGEYKMMGLAPYGKPVYADLIFTHLVDLKDDGSFHLNMRYFGYGTGFMMTNENFHNLFGGPPRAPESPITQKDMDIAASIQKVTEDIIERIARHVLRTTGMTNLCLAGGVALNCVANGRLLAHRVTRNLWIQPAAGDAGSALGSALFTWYQYLKNPRTASPEDSMQGSYLGPQFTDDEIRNQLDRAGAIYDYYTDSSLLAKDTAKIIAAGMVVAWFQGRMEFGPRALGARSILGDPRNSDMQSLMNLKIKFRESFRPFAPSVLEEFATEYFEDAVSSPYMLLTFPVQRTQRFKTDKKEGFELLKLGRGALPAITHVDYSARVHTVSRATNPFYHQMMSEFNALTGCPVIINTSFNVRGEPIVCTPIDAYRCFMRTHIDCLVIGNFILQKNRQPPFIDDPSWKANLELD